MTNHEVHQLFPEVSINYEDTFKWGSFGQTDAAIEAYGLKLDYTDYPDQEKTYGGVTNFSIMLATPEEVDAPDLEMRLDKAIACVDTGEDAEHAPRMVIALPISREHYVHTLAAQRDWRALELDPDEYLRSLKAALRPESDAFTTEELLNDLYTERVVESVTRLVCEAGREALLSSLQAQRQEEVSKLTWEQRLGTLAYGGAVGAGELFIPISTGALTAIEGLTMATGYGAYRWLHGRMRDRTLRPEPRDEAMAQQIADDIAESIQASFSPDWHINRETEELQRLLDAVDPTTPED